MAKNFLEALGKIALFRAKESSLGEPQSGSGVTMAFDSGSGLGLVRTIEDDREQVRGRELAGEIYLATQTTAGKLSQKRVKPDFLSFVLAYFLGQVQTQELAPGIYQHTISADSALELPSFTLLQRRGDSIFKERFSGNLIESFSLELGESWVSLSAEVKGIGRREVNYEHEVVKAPANSTQLTLSNNGVQGASDQARRENVYRVRARDFGSSLWQIVKVISVSETIPAVLILEEPLGESEELIDFHIDYIPLEPSWCEFPEEQDESPLRLVDAKVIIDGYFDGSEVLGGEIISQELLSFSLQGKNNLQIRKLADGSSQLWASEVIRSPRELTIKISEQLKNTIRQWQADHPETEQLSVYLKIRGAEIVPQTGFYFGADFIFPRCALLQAPVVVNSKFLAQEGDLLVMDDGNYGGVFIRSWNQVSGYLG